MSNLTKRITEYILDIPKIIVVAIPITELLLYLGLFSTERVFVLCYLLIFFITYGLSRILGREKLYLVFSSFVLLAMGIIFRDKILFLNMALAFLVMLLVYVMNLKMLRRFAWPVVAFAELGVWIYFWNMSRPVAVCLVLLALFAIVEYVKKDIGYYMPVLLILGLIVMFIPSKEEPIQWTFVKNAVSKTVTVVTYIGDEIEYLFGNIFHVDQEISGYADTGQLQGKVSSSVREEMVYDLFANTKAKSVYLKGASYSKIGTGGMSQKEAADEYYNAWFIEYINALHNAGMSEEKVACFNRIDSGDIMFKYLRTSDIICPQNTFFLSKIYDQDINNIELNEKDLKKRKKKDYEYRAQYLTIDYASPYFRELVLSRYDENGNYIDMSYADYYDLMDYVREVLNINMSTRITKQRYDQIVKYLDKNDPFKTENGYLDASMSTDRIRDLVAEITEGCESDFEKAKRIEAYLRQYSYDRRVDLRESSNYVDDFLFVTQSGYCVHYASSMVLMLRTCGIPARYSNGFLHKYELKGTKVTNVIVNSDEAHAWPEAYIDGIGWIPFEPTTVMGSAEQSAWGLTVSDEEADGALGSATDSDMAYPSGIDVVPRQGDIPEQYKKYMQEQGQIQTPVQIDRNVEKTRRNIALRALYYTAMMMATVVIILIMIKIIRMIWYMRLSPEKKLQENIGRICRKLNRKNLEDIKIESIYDYLLLLDSDEEKERLRDVFDRYYRVRFRGDDPEPDFIKLTQKYRIVK